MAERVVLDAGPIIALGRAGALDVLGRLPFEFLSPLEVGAERKKACGGGTRGLPPLRFVLRR
ncbi:MAG TPA: hypothetical protein VN894_13620 [Polyangiaceae bacterium]|nr:hypothetical protein [Polyangiaceae bacterium]